MTASLRLLSLSLLAVPAALLLAGVASAQSDGYDENYGAPPPTGAERAWRFGPAPNQVVEDPVYGDFIYGATGAPRFAAESRVPVRYRVGAQLLSAAKSSFSDSEGDLAVDRAGVDLGADIALGEGAGMSIGGLFEYSYYHFDNAEGFGGGNVFRSVYIASLFGSVWKQIDDQFTGFASYAFGMGWQEGSEPADGQSWVLTAGGTAQAQDNLRLGFAVGTIDRLKKSTAFFIYPIIDWRISPEWRIATAETGLPGGAIFFEPDDRFSIYGAVGYELRQFRTKRNGPLEHDAMHDERVRLSGGVRWTMGTNAALWTEGGVYLYQQLERRNEFGGLVNKENSDPSLFASVRVQYAW